MSTLNRAIKLMLLTAFVATIVQFVPPVIAIQVTGALVGATFTLFIFVGFFSSFIYNTKKADKRAERVRIAIPTIASDSVSDALIETIEHTKRNFGEYELYCVIDEGADLSETLYDTDGITVIEVPENYSCQAKAKGRAINYFIESIIGEEPDYWYAFIDDDNRILDDTWLYEIPHYENEGYVAMNPILIPRLGESRITFMADHIRYLDDMFIFRTFTGLFKKPYVGFHGELLCAKGEIFADVTFDRPSIVEDFAFSMKLIERGECVWQSETNVSILSPHTITAFYKQRRRWLTGILAHLHKCPTMAALLITGRTLMWLVSITSSWIFVPLILIFGSPLPMPLVVVVALGSLFFIAFYAYGAYRIDGIRTLPYALLFPVYAFMDQSVPFYSYLYPESNFTVIDK